MTLNSSMMGIAYKLNMMDLLGGSEPVGIAKVVTWVHTGFLLIAIIVAGRRQRVRGGTTETGADENVARMAMARCWLALLILGQMRSPFLPWGYGNVMVLWLLALMIPEGRRWLAGLIVLVPIWAYYATPIPLPFGPPMLSVDLIYTLGATVMTLILCFGVTLSRPRPETATI
jgi:hypothetical protein